MIIPPHYMSLAEALVSLFGTSVAIVKTERISGGDINSAYSLTLNTGNHIFMKANSKENSDFFTSEALGLAALASTNTIKTAKVLCTGTDNGQESGYSFMLLEFIESSQATADRWESFAQDLAALHIAETKEIMETDAKFGFFQNNFIGSSHQDNSQSNSWVDFFRDKRLVPQFKAADSYFSEENRKLITKLLDHLDNFLIEPAKASLVHGDLWSGNVMFGKDGRAILIDPAAHIACPEVDLAMTELFGAFPKVFYQAYRAANPLEPGYEERRDLYNLYHILNHLNLFGKTYLDAVLTIISEYVS